MLVNVLQFSTICVLQFSTICVLQFSTICVLQFKMMLNTIPQCLIQFNVS